MEPIAPLIKVPYPIQLTVDEILERRSDDKLKSRPPNSYFLYRMSYLKELRKRVTGNFSMTKLSKNISDSWKEENPCIKQAYKELSNKVGSQLEEKRKKGLCLIPEIFPSPSAPPPPPSPPTPPPQRSQYSSQNLSPEHDYIYQNVPFYPSFMHDINIAIENGYYHTDLPIIDQSLFMEQQYCWPYYDSMYPEQQYY
ncbi:hypothetical protein C1645_730807 [Glomus cerebriforme]|uniref:HMG box domain-containing protein n=1 Tax=Glomus cerebriforme TaxID=658196 RepID=A0A397TSD2_9GLOM|nr:hypothetical protein C1645_730807 [Glomus cerebriforme]